MSGATGFAVEFALPDRWATFTSAEREEWAFSSYHADGTRVSVPESRWRVDQYNRSATHAESFDTEAVGTRRRSLTTLMQREFAALDWVVPDVIPEGTALLVAPPKAGKSLLVLDIALACATGGNAFGGVPVGAARPVLYLDLESGERRLQRRVEAQDWAEFGLFEYHLERATAWEELESFMTEHRGSRPLAVIDTLAAVMPPKGKDVTNYQHEYDTLARLQRLTRDDPGSAIVIVHHTRKAVTGDPMERISGTNGLAGAVDTPIVLDRPDRKAPEGTLFVMSRDVEDAEFAVKLDGARWTLDGIDPDAARDMSELRGTARDRLKLGTRSQHVLLAVETFGRPVSPSDIESAVAGLTRAQADKALYQLTKAGWVERVGRGLYQASQVEEVEEVEDSQRGRSAT